MVPDIVRIAEWPDGKTLVRAISLRAYRRLIIQRYSAAGLHEAKGEMDGDTSTVTLLDEDGRTPLIQYILYWAAVDQCPDITSVGVTAKKGMDSELAHAYAFAIHELSGMAPMSDEDVAALEINEIPSDLTAVELKKLAGVLGPVTTDYDFSTYLMLGMLAPHMAKMEDFREWISGL